MKKIFVTLAVIATMVLASSCGSRQTKVQATEEVEAVADSVSVSDTVVVDSVVTEAE